MTPPTPDPPPAARRNRVLWQAALILLAGLFIYAPAFRGGWLLDDDYEVTDNAALQSPAGLAAIWRGEVGADYLPLKTSLQWLLWRAFGSNPTPFHLTSIALHLLSALLFWRLLQRLGMPHGWLGGLIFAVHPIEVESVAWISELKNTLSLAWLFISSTGPASGSSGWPPPASARCTTGPATSGAPGCGWRAGSASDARSSPAGCMPKSIPMSRR